MLGAGPDLLLAPGFVTHLDLMWGLPPFEAMLKLGRIFRVIVLDKRGTGLSDRCLWGRRGGWCPLGKKGGLVSDNGLYLAYALGQDRA